MAIAIASSLPARKRALSDRAKFPKWISGCGLAINVVVDSRKGRSLTYGFGLYNLAAAVEHVIHKRDSRATDHQTDARHLGI